MSSPWEYQTFPWSAVTLELSSLFNFQGIERLPETIRHDQWALNTDHYQLSLCLPFTTLIHIVSLIIDQLSFINYHWPRSTIFYTLSTILVDIISAMNHNPPARLPRRRASEHPWSDGNHPVPWQVDLSLVDGQANSNSQLIYRHQQPLSNGFTTIYQLIKVIIIRRH